MSAVQLPIANLTGMSIGLQFNTLISFMSALLNHSESVCMHTESTIANQSYQLALLLPWRDFADTCRSLLYTVTRSAIIFIKKADFKWQLTVCEPVDISPVRFDTRQLPWITGMLEKKKYPVKLGDG